MSEAQQTAEEVMAPYRFLIESALDFSGDTHDYADIVAGVKNMTMFFWPAEKSCLVTEIVQYPKKRALHVFLAAGDLSEIKGMEPSLQEFAKNLKCDAISLTGRNGWKRTLNNMGYKPAHITMVKEL
tara:strand:+ start:139 stop:519 length:381 start_codon:yes stop_codon:yes gene_type:complete